MKSTSPKAALVTGAAKRIGRAIALALAEQGWDIVVHYLNSAAEAQATVSAIQALGRNAVAIHCDLADPTSVLGLLERANAAIGTRIQCVVNSASLFEFDDARDFSAARLERHMQINLSAPIVLAQALHATTKDGEVAVVVNLLDQKLYNLNPDYLSYTLSKSGLQTATTLLAQALAPKVRVVAVAPGITLISGDQTTGGFDKAHTMTPLGRSSTLDDISAAVCFLAQSPAITGTTLLVDGGQHLLPLARDVMFVA